MNKMISSGLYQSSKARRKMNVSGAKGKRICQSNANNYPRTRIAGELEVYQNLGITDRVVRINILFLKINEIPSEKLHSFKKTT